MATSDHQRSLEANSGAAFVRKTALRLDPTNAPRMHMFAWNVFMDSRGRGNTTTTHLNAAQSIAAILSEVQMRDLVATYFRVVDPVYGFVERQDVEMYIVATWSDDGAAQESNGSCSSLQDAVLCGVAALGLLFTNIQSSALENDLVDMAKLKLDRSMLDVKCVVAITAWILRVVYLRITGTPHKTWMASCILMHMIEAAGLHYACSSNAESILYTSAEDGKEAHAEQRRRLVAVAQHLNIWTSFDIGRSHVKLSNATSMLPSARPGDYTRELMKLLPYSALLDPEKTPDVSALRNALSAVFLHIHSISSSILAQVNLALCLYRRLQSMNASLTGRVLDEMLALLAKGIQAAQANLDARHPWHHVANIPFQTICVLLSIDAVSVASQLTDAMQCLSNVATVYNSEAAREAMRTASLLILLHKRWRERAVSDLGGVLDRFPVAPLDEGSSSSDARTNVAGNGGSVAMQPEVRWLNSLEENLTNMQYFDIDQFFNGGESGQPDGYVF